MPVVYRIDAARKLIDTRCVGYVNFNEVLNHFQTLLDDPECPDRLDVLLDLREVTSVPEDHQLRQLSYKIGSISDRLQFGACAIVATADVIFGMARMFEVFAEKWFKEIRVFRDVAEAQEWLKSEKPVISKELPT